MSNPLIHAFFLGRAVAETLQEQAERSFTDLLSEIGKLDAEQRERLRQFTEQVNERAQHAEAVSMQGRSTPGNSHADGFPAVDLQATIDDLRAEVARLRAELKHHRDVL
jgi:uncharacterized protein YceH (UPF0502 family)